MVLAIPDAARAAIATSPVNITTPGGATALVNTILGPGITVLTVSPGVGSATSAGTFTGGLSAGIGMDTGIVLTSGNVALIDGTNSSDSSSGTASAVGDADLNTLIPGTTDTTFLEFTFQFGDGTIGGDVFFNYVFASEEYNEYAGSTYNDVFGFFLDDSNVALIPSTSTPVAINTVNLGVNSAFYNNNDPDDGGSLPFEYDGFTDVFTVSALGLGSGLHTIKLAISDVGDQSYDSAVFIQAGTFSTDPSPPGTPDVPEPSQVLVWLGLAACASTVKVVRAATQRRVA
jgi:hypothetical protein